MSFTEHEAGSVPSATDVNADPLVVVAPKHLNYLLVAVISFLVPLAGLIMAIGYNKKVTKHNQQVEAPKVSARNYWLVVGISVVLAFAAVAYVNRPSNSLNNMTFTVVGTGPVAPSVQPSQAAPSAAVQAPDALPTNPVASGPVQPVAATATDLIRIIEAYRMQAFATGNISLLDSYYANHQMIEWQHDTQVIAEGKTVGNYFATITKIDLVSVTDSSMVVNLTYSTKQIANGVATTYVDNFHNTYQVINNRWLLTKSE